LLVRQVPLRYDLEQHPAAAPDPAVRVRGAVRVADRRRRPKTEPAVHGNEIIVRDMASGEQVLDQGGVVFDYVVQRLDPERGELVWVGAVNTDLVSNSHAQPQPRPPTNLEPINAATWRG
jgi:hypothetical protein